jgi:hypothetical protein
MTFYPPNITSTNKDLEAKMRTEMNERNIGCPQLEKTLHLAASLIEVRRYTSYYILPQVPH